VLDRWITLGAARDDYGVVLTGGADAEDLAVDPAATESLRSQIRAARDRV
jgi:hypothetical protein